MRLMHKLSADSRNIRFAILAGKVMELVYIMLLDTQFFMMGEC